MVNYKDRIEKLVSAYGSQSKTAKSLGVSQPYVSRMLSGKRNPSKKVKTKINKRYNYQNKRKAFQTIMEVYNRQEEEYNYYPSMLHTLEATEKMRDRMFNSMTASKGKDLFVVSIKTRRLNRTFKL